MKPIIAIGAYPRVYETAFGATLMHTASRHYVAAVRRAGGTPIILPVTEPSAVSEVIGVAHGVLLTGGGDIQPSRYGAIPQDGTRHVDPERDAFEVALFDACVAVDLPLLAVCRGMQMMNVASGGTLYQDVYAATGLYHDDYSRWREPVHKVKLEPHRQLANALGVVELPVNSVHHQGIDRLGDGLRAVAWADDDTVEGVELDGATFAVGVQWHPEVLEDEPEHQGLFRTFVKQAAARLT